MYDVDSSKLCAEPQDEQPAIEDVRRAQKLVCELLWISCNSRPDLCFTISRLGQLVTKTPVFVLEAGHTVLKYLRHTKDYSMTYLPPTGTRGRGGGRAIARDMKAVEIFADASLSPGTERSQSGAVLTWGGSPLSWVSLRQPTASLSTPEAELSASVDGICLTNAVLPLMCELVKESLKPVLYSDNVGTCTLLQVPQGTWRTRHLRLKAQWFLERVEKQQYMYYHLPGAFMTADMPTSPCRAASCVSS